MPQIISRPGQVNSAGDPRELFMKVFTTEVQATFEKDNAFMDLHRVRTIEHGKSASFPFVGNIGATYHTPGTDLVGGKINHAEKVINVDNVLLAQARIASIEEAMNHFDLRQEYSRELGRALKREFASKLTRLFARAARTVGVLENTWYPNYGSSGALTSATAAKDSNLKDANAGTVAATLLAKLWYALQVLDEKQVPDEDRYILLAPAQFYLLIGQGGSMNSSGSILNREVGGAGSIASGTMPELGNARFIKTSLMPQLQWSRDSEGMPDTSGTRGLITSDSIGNTGGQNYNGDFSKTVALVVQKGAIGTVKLKDLQTEAEYTVKSQGTLMVAKYAMGHDVLRPECAVEITTDAVSPEHELPNN